jgi:hypothetical protein
VRTDRLPLPRLHRWLIFITFLPVLLLSAQAATPPLIRSTRSISSTFGALPIGFEENDGQAGANVHFLSRGKGFSLSLKQNEADFVLARPSSSPRAGNAGAGCLRMQFIGHAAAPAIAGEHRLPGTVNYLVGNNPSRWQVGVPTFSRVKYTGVYPGINLVYYGKQGKLEFDFEVAAGVDPKLIQLRWKGAHEIKIDPAGNLIIATRDGHLSFHKPVIYQSAGQNGEHFVPGAFRITGRHSVGFALGPYDPGRALIIDPILDYSTYVGPSSVANAIAVDAAGEAYVAGYAGAGFPITAGSFENSISPGAQAAYVAKFNSTGTALLYSTYLSGSTDSGIYGLAIDAAGNAYVAGATNSKDFPVTAGALQMTDKAAGAHNTSGFVAVINNTGTGLIYSTFLGGSTQSGVNGIAIDASGSAYVTGFTYDTDFPTTAGAFQLTVPKKATAGQWSGFVSKLNPAGTALIYSTYLAGTELDNLAAIAVDAAGDALVTGYTGSPDFPTTSGAFQPTKHALLATAFITKMNPAGTGLLYSTFLGGGYEDEATAIALDAAGDAYITGNTTSVDFPITPGVFQPSLKLVGTFPPTNAFITKINSSGSALLYSTFLGSSVGTGGPSTDSGTGIAVDAQGNAVLAGFTNGLDFPLIPGALQTQNLGQLDSLNSTSFLTRINPTASAILYSTYLGGTGDGDEYECDCATGIALDSPGNTYVAGVTVSDDFPTTPGVVQTPFQTDETQSFVTKFDASELTILPATTLTLSSNATSVEYGNPVSFTATVNTTSGSTATGVIAFNYPAAELSVESYFGMSPWSSVPVNGSGAATFTTASLIPSWGTIYAYYLGDANNAPSTGTYTVTVTPIPTVETLVSSANPAVYGAPVVFAATVLDNTGQPAKGYVDFQIGQTVAATVDLDQAGQASWVNGSAGLPLSIGANSVQAKYFGYTGYQSNTAVLVETFTPLGTAPAPTFAPPAGTYTSVQQVILSNAMANFAMYYTTDGSTPTAGVSNPYAPGFPIQVNASETIQAIAVAPGYTTSSVAAAAYIIDLPPPDFSLTLTPASIALAAGQSATTNVSVAPVNGFTQTVSLSCSGLPSGVTCGFAPASIASGENSTLTISASSTANLHARRAQVPVPLLIMWLGLAAGTKITRRRRLHWMRLMAFIAALFVLNGCGGGSQPSDQNPNPPSTTTTVTITGTSGSLSHNAQLTVTVN